jgi:two-component system, NtrC family, nitrogen regulation response regulator NtrX
MVHSILVIDDEKDISELLCDILNENDYTSDFALDSTTAIAKLSTAPSAIILDIWLKGSEYDGLELLELIKMSYPHTPVVVISGHGNTELAISAVKQGAFDYLDKPFSSSRILLTVRNAIASVARSNIVLPEFILSSTDSKKVISDGRVMLNSKDPLDFAYFIHRHSRRKECNFVVANLDGDVDLFGVANPNLPHLPIKLGLIEQANGGTILLKNIHQLK